MNDDADTANEPISFVIRFTPSNDEMLGVIVDYFRDENVSYTRGFTGVEKVVIIARYTRHALAKMLAWFHQHQGRLEGATIEVGKEKVLIKGYTIGDVNELLKTGMVNKILRDLNR